MARTIYALLVGIDRYASARIPPLHGCVNDVTAISELLAERMVSGEFSLEMRTLINDGATYEAILDGFQTHLSKAGTDDVALFYYSGHGSQEQAPSVFWHLEPDKLNETLVCHDSRTEGHYDLSDKELGKLLADVAAHGPHVVVVLDCCHSGTGTRDDALSDAVIRRTTTDGRSRPLETYRAFSSAELQKLTEAEAGPEGSWVTLPAGDHVLLAACYDFETAKELPFDGTRRGVFSYYLLDTLRQSGRTLTYRDLFKRVEALVKNRVQNQTPMVEAPAGSDLDRPFLGGAVSRNAYYTLSYNQARGWTIDGGAVHGISQPGAHGTTTFAMFTRDATDLRTLDAAIGEAKVIDVQPQFSQVSITLKDGNNPDHEQTYKAVIVSNPLAPLGVVLEGDAEGVALVEQAIAVAGPQQQPSLYIRHEPNADAAQLRVLAEDNRLRITRPKLVRPLTSDLDGYTAEQAGKTVQRLEHIARWTTISNLENPGSRLAGAVRLEVHRITAPPVVRSPDAEETAPFLPGEDIRLEYRYNRARQRWEPPAYKIRLVNTTDEELHCALAYLSEEFAITTSAWFPGGTVRLAPHGEAWAARKMAIPSTIPDALLEQGVTEYRDTYKLVVSNEAFDATLLEQDDLDLPLVPKSVRSIGSSILDRLLDNARTRKPDLSLQRDLYADWATATATITIVHPRTSIDVPGPSDEPRELLKDGAITVTLQPHATLHGRARLTTVPQAGRDLGTATQPPLLRDHPEESYLYQFTTSRSSDPGLGVLELLDVANPEEVTPNAPLRLRVHAPGTRETHVAATESLLPYAFDGEFFLPLGSATPTEDGVEIELRYLPSPLTQANIADPEIGDRSLTGSIRIFFQKIVHTRLGLEHKYPLLRTATVADDGTVTYEEAVTTIKSRVTDAERIVLYIHGIIGDTEGMVASSRCLDFPAADSPPSLYDRYDLVLAFDYENLHTSIKETAVKLRERLTEVGLGAGHGKTLHVVAHSMGGLVTRWFIEREGGKDMVQRLILIGTPSGGSPWPELQEMGATLLAGGLNLVSGLFWPAKVLSGLVRLVERVDVTFDEMRPTSQFLEDLWQNPDPGIPYTVIAGNTTLIPGMQEEQNRGRFARLVDKLQRIYSPETLHRLTSMAFLEHPNDIAVAVSSAHRFAPERHKELKLIEAACDHITYFSTAAGLVAVAEGVEVQKQT